MSERERLPASDHLPALVEKLDEAVPAAPGQSLEDLTRQLHAMVDEGRRLHAKRVVLDGKIEDLQLRCGQRLIEMRRRIEAGEVGDLAAVDWWGWYADAVPHISRKYAERWMAIASAADPEAAAVEYRERNASYQRAHRERARIASAAPPLDLTRECKIQAPEEKGTAPDSQTEELPPPAEASAPVLVARKRAPLFSGHDIDESAEIELALMVFRRLSWNGRAQLLKELNKLYDEWRSGRA
jgi:hypothetical protein